MLPYEKILLQSVPVNMSLLMRRAFFAVAKRTAARNIFLL
ncbi:hypothetical protein SBDP1_980002 [Syntrophobacter sp. SbD1]|nr:hypothetical protein SBDP1_980002 [Syntrophobacter sp. SbD1]